MSAPVVKYISSIKSVTCVTKTIPSYLYYQYSDDGDLQAFVKSYNSITQEYVDWFNNTPLPVYTSTAISGPLLDWVAEGLYGITRPLLPSTTLSRSIGGYDTCPFNSLAYNQYKVLGPSGYYNVNDDVFKRIITWNFYKGDGRFFTTRWLKRRVIRFLVGVNGTDFGLDNLPWVDQTYRVSVLFGPNYKVNIGVVNSHATPIGGAVYGLFEFNTAGYNVLKSRVTTYSPFPMASTFITAVNSGILKLPFQYSWTASTIG